MSAMNIPAKRSDSPTLQTLCAECPQLSVCGFAGLDRWRVEKSLHPIVVTRYRADRTVLTEGAPANGVHVVCRGMVIVTTFTDGGEEAALYLLGTGGILDVTDGFLGQSVSSVSAKTLTEAVVLFVKPEILHERVKAEPDLMVRLCRQVTFQMRHLQERYGRLWSHSALSRVGYALLDLVQASGQAASGKVVLPIRLKRSLLAQIAGTTQETISRVLMSLRKRRLIQQSDGKIPIPNVDRLQSVVSKNTPPPALPGKILTR